MGIRLPYGAGRELQFDWPSSLEIFDHGQAARPGLVDVEQSTRQALGHPSTGPALLDSVVAGDRVVLALDPCLPCLDRLVAGIVSALLDAGNSPQNLTILWSGSTAEQAPPVGMLAEEIRSQVRVVRHDPDDAQTHAYLAATEEGEPIYLNRELCDADLVLPVGLLRPVETLGNLGLAGVVFPNFSNRATQHRLRAAVGTSRVAKQKRRRAVAEETAWLLGVQLALGAIPGTDSSLVEILAGPLDALSSAGARRSGELWRLALAEPAAMAVAALDGGPEQQTWDNLARAIHVANLSVADGGSIVLVTQLATRPGSALKRFGRWTEDLPLPKLRKEEIEPDAVAAQCLLAARQRCHVYLMSDLPRRAVETLGVIAIDEPADIERLGKRQRSCLVLGGAQFASVSVESLEPA